MGLTDVPVMMARGWTEAQKRAYVLADNKLALNADWDPELLRTELVDLQGMGADLGLIGFSDDEIRILTADKNEGPSSTLAIRLHNKACRSAVRAGRAGLPRARWVTCKLQNPLATTDAIALWRGHH